MKNKYLSTHPLHRGYHSMKARCYNPNSEKYSSWGGRGIIVCDEWLSDKWVFVAWAYEGGWEQGLTLNRIDNDGPYAPWNCEWTTHESQNNNKRNNVLITALGETKTLSNWGKDIRSVVTQEAISRRISKGWSAEDAITTPTTIPAFGEEKTINGWASDSRCAVRETALRQRLSLGWSIEDSIMLPPKRGVPRTQRSGELQ